MAGVMLAHQQILKEINLFSYWVCSLQGSCPPNTFPWFWCNCFFTKLCGIGSWDDVMSQPIPLTLFFGQEHEGGQFWDL